MSLRIFSGFVLAWSGVMMNAQQALFVSPGGIVVFKDNSISTVDKDLSKDEMTFKHGERIYPNGGPAYFEMLEKNPIKYNVMDHVCVKDGKIQFDGATIEVGVQVDRIDKALRWGELVACLVIIPNTPTHWLEPKKAHALVVFSPKTRKGGFKALYLASGKARSDLWLLDPIEKGK